MSDLIELIHAFGASHSVKFHGASDLEREAGESGMILVDVPHDQAKATHQAPAYEAWARTTAGCAASAGCRDPRKPWVEHKRALGLGGSK